MHRFRLLITGLLACAMLGAGGFTSIVQAHYIQAGQSQSTIDKGFPRTERLWPKGQSIPVCWDLQVQAFNDYAAKREIVRQAVANTWEAVSLVRFVDWNRCTGPDNQGITIAVNLDVPATYGGLGTGLKNLKPGMRLNFENLIWDCTSVSLGECIRQAAVHEFGHALGFAHEQRRVDGRPASCNAELESGTPGDTPFGPWDAQSVMNYCNRIPNNSGVLSDGDIKMVKYYYGDPDPVPDFDMSPITLLLFE